MRIGIPRALLYHWYGPFWEDFWRECGCEVLVSPPTDRAMIAAGSAVAVEELCLPVKIFLGHARHLAEQVDYIMLPHLIKVEPEAFICPKFMGLPDIVRHTLGEFQPKMLPMQVGPEQPQMLLGLITSARRIGITNSRLSEVQKRLRQRPLISPTPPRLQALPHHLNDGRSPRLTIGLLGHAYCLNDPGFNLDLLHKLTGYGAAYLLPEQMPADFKGIGSGKLNKPLFWTVGRNQLDAVEWLLEQSETPVDGLIQVAPFGCGIEAMVGDLVERRIKQAGKPVLKLNFDQHSGEAGLVTRLEAFLDLLRYRRLVS